MRAITCEYVFPRTLSPFTFTSRSPAGHRHVIILGAGLYVDLWPLTQRQTRTTEATIFSLAVLFYPFIKKKHNTQNIILWPAVGETCEWLWSVYAFIATSCMLEQKQRGQSVFAYVHGVMNVSLDVMACALFWFVRADCHSGASVTANRDGQNKRKN